jgi:hypothetical protein
MYAQLKIVIIYYQINSESMFLKKYLLSTLTATIFFLLPFLIMAQEEEEEDIIAGEKPELLIGELTTDFNFDGFYNLKKWQIAADSIADLITIEPEEGGEPERMTTIKVFANRNEIIVAARCFDEPDGIVSFSKARDSELDEEDHLLVVFDTFLDGRSGYVFAINPEGARFDGLVIEQGEDVNSDWDAIWEAKTSRDNSGWYVEIRIPIKSLSFEKDLTDWGFNVQRRVQRIQETSRWSAPSRDFEIFQTNRAGLLKDLPVFDFGVGLSIRPSILSRARKENGIDTEFEFEPSLDVTQRLGPNLLSSLTINTDFAETEIDVRQINLTRFPTFFPEKRTFFLQGSDIFEFGFGLDEDNLIPFFSRRIGLFGTDEDEQREVPINVGVKINGRIDNTNLGALVVNTRQMDNLQLGDEDEDISIDVPQTTMGTIRIKQNILEESSFGVISSFGDQIGRSGSWSGGVDFVFRTSDFLDEKNFLIGVWGLLNDREDLTGDKSAFGLRIDYPNDLFDINFSTIRLGDGFDPSLGFVPRNNLHIWEFSGEYKPRPDWELVREMTHELSLLLSNKRNNSTWESYEVIIKPVDWLFESGERFEAGIEPQGDRPPEPFEFASDSDIPSGSYEWIRYFAGINSAYKRIVSGGVRYEFGDYYNGDLTTIEANLAFKPSAFFTIELTGERNTGKATVLPEDYEELIEEGEEIELVEKEFIEQLFGIRLLLNISADLQISSFTQYDTQSRELGTNNRLRWTFDPFGEIFIVYNHNEIWRADKERLQFVSNELPIKIQYTLRF